MKNIVTVLIIGIIAMVIIAMVGITIHSNKAELEQKKLESQREYVADQKSACFEIYKEEGEKWNNVTGWRYEEIGDSCFVEYKETPARTQDQCDQAFKNEEGDLIPIFIVDWLNCNRGVFETEF